ncbi:MAG: hypothetical protein NTV34_09220 [Proteobacteria bacterium]|nr:hypothetical protein [Pseudomonadota bacterium]
MSQFVVLITLVMLFCESLYADERAVYILPQPGGFVEISGVPREHSGILMRDPDLGQAPMRASHEAKPDKVKSKVVGKVAKSSKSMKKFKAMRVAGTVRMPRVEFARSRQPLGIREESPDLDFSNRSLRDLP